MKLGTAEEVLKFRGQSSRSLLLKLSPNCNNNNDNNNDTYSPNLQMQEI